jgi:hypothetical protein
VDEFVEWLRAQLDEDERIARATTWEGSGNKLDWELIASATIDVGGDEFYVGDRAIANHMMAWEPARVLREIDAKRRLLDEHALNGWACATCDTGEVEQVFPCPTLRILALPYADRPGYHEEWRP